MSIKKKGKDGEAESQLTIITKTFNHRIPSKYGTSGES